MIIQWLLLTNPFIFHVRQLTIIAQHSAPFRFQVNPLTADNSNMLLNTLNFMETSTQFHLNMFAMISQFGPREQLAIG